MDDDEMSDPKVDTLAKALTPAAVNDMIAKTAHKATMDERHRLTAGDSVNALDQAFKSLKR
jgi:hypothetical protein